MKATMKGHLGLLIITLAMVTIDSVNLSAQDGTTYMRIAKITVDSTKLDEYKTALKEQMKSAIRLEKGVLSYSAVQDKRNPSKITIQKHTQVRTHIRRTLKQCISKNTRQLLWTW